MFTLLRKIILVGVTFLDEDINPMISKSTAWVFDISRSIIIGKKVVQK